ncbi:MAG: hypothetical protein HZA48_02075, partial [Planctomycetes bacterium]|nr:hypothetical protein [Planctomycetota bacterium]
EKAKEELDKMVKKGMDELDKRKLEALAQRQKEIKEQTEKTAEDIKNQGQKDAAEKLNNAADSMSSAAQKMQNDDSKKAEEDQEDALDQLQRAYESLKEQAEELAQQKRDEQLRKLQQELENTLSAQKVITEQTGAMELKKMKSEDNAFSREDYQVLIGLSDEEEKLAKGLKSIKDDLEAEQATVYPFQMSAIVDDMMFIEKLLGEGFFRTDSVTQEAELDVEYRLQELIDALKKERGRKVRPFGGSPQGGGGASMKQPLLPKIAELKLLKQLQIDIKKRTERITKEIDSSKPVEPIMKEVLKRLAAEQLNLGRLTTDFIKQVEEEMKKEQGEEKREGE